MRLCECLQELLRRSLMLLYFDLLTMIVLRLAIGDLGLNKYCQQREPFLPPEITALDESWTVSPDMAVPFEPICKLSSWENSDPPLLPRSALCDAHCARR